MKLRGKVKLLVNILAVVFFVMQGGDKKSQKLAVNNTEPVAAGETTEKPTPGSTSAESGKEMKRSTAAKSDSLPSSSTPTEGIAGGKSPAELNSNDKVDSKGDTKTVPVKVAAVTTTVSDRKKESKAKAPVTNKRSIVRSAKKKSAAEPPAPKVVKTVKKARRAGGTLDDLLAGATTEDKSNKKKKMVACKSK